LKEGNEKPTASGRILKHFTYLFHSQRLNGKIDRSFEISNKAVTFDQFKQFDPKYYLDAKYIRSGDLPIVGINYYMAIKYCNWLSEKEGIPEDQWCFETFNGGKTIAIKKD
jgi:formylglycine-generating enzyme required for sulfatase activity